jgi:Zn-dependent protease with chaperone function
MVAIQLLAYFVCAAFLSFLANWFGLIPWRNSASAHWTERARLLWPVRFTAGLNVFLLPPILNLIQEIFFPNVPHWWIADLIAGFFGAVLGCFPCDREIFPLLDFHNWWHQAVASWGIRFGIWGLLLLGCFLMPENVSWKMLAVTAGYLLIHFAFQWGLILKYLRLVNFLTPAGNRLLEIVNLTATRMGVSVRATWELDGFMALAFAFPTTNELVFSRRLMEICSDEEISSICAHELAHLKESKSVLAGRLIGSLSIFPLIFISPSIHQFGMTGIFLPYVGLFSIAKFSRWLSQRMEKRADQLALNEQTQEGVYAGALEKIYCENKIPAVNVNDKQTHPHLYDRMVAAGITPDYPRPTRPSRLTVIGWVYAFSIGILFMLLVSHG